MYDFVIEYIDPNCNNGTLCCHKVIIKKDDLSDITSDNFIIMNGIEIAEYFKYFKVDIPQHFVHYVNSFN